MDLLGSTAWPSVGPAVAGLSVLAAIAGFLSQATPAAAGSGRPSRTASAAAFDVSYPQCGSRLPSGGQQGVVGVSAGIPWSSNSCLSSEYSWAASKPQPVQLYMNTANPDSASSFWPTRAGSRPRTCTAANLTHPTNVNCPYNYGQNAAPSAISNTTTTI